MSPAKRDWSGCNTEAGGVALLESIWDPLPLQVVVEVAVEPSEVAECGGGCALFPPSSSFNLDFSEAAAAASSYCCSIYQYYYYSFVNDRLEIAIFQVPKLARKAIYICLWEESSL